MNLDLAVVALLVLFAVLGAVSGALRQVVHLGAALLGYLAARQLAPRVAAGLAGGAAQSLARAIAGILIFFATLAVASFAGNALARRLGGGTASRGPSDRGLGALLGAAKATLGVWVLLSAWTLAGIRFGPLDPRGSDFAALARDYNALDAWRSPAAATLRRLLRALRDPGAETRLRDDGDVRALLEDPRLRQLAGEADLDTEAFGRHPGARELLSDPAFLRRLEKAQRRIEEAGE